VFPDTSAKELSEKGSTYIWWHRQLNSFCFEDSDIPCLLFPLAGSDLKNSIPVNGLRIIQFYSKNFLQVISCFCFRNVKCGMGIKKDLLEFRTNNTYVRPS
jgi:hypothetical protein